MRPVLQCHEDFVQALGKTLGPTEWLIIDQTRIDTFADATGDHQWIHVDVERAKSSNFGGTIAHGYLTLSLIAGLKPQLWDLRGFTFGLNYGVNKVRFPAAVRSGLRVRATGELVSVEKIDEATQAILRVTVEIEGGAKPACVAETISRLYWPK